MVLKDGITIIVYYC